MGTDNIPYGTTMAHGQGFPITTIIDTASPIRHLETCWAVRLVEYWKASPVLSASVRHFE
jgi:hypothetical protein